MATLGISIAVTENGAALVRPSFTHTDAIINRVDTTVAASKTDVEYSWTVDISELGFLIMHSDQDITVETNSSSAPTQTFALVANVPVIWHQSMPAAAANPITADVTKIFFTTGAITATANVVLIAAMEAV